MAIDVEIDTEFLVPFSCDESKILIKKSIQDMHFFAKSLTVDSQDSYKKMTSFYVKAREWKKLLDAKRKELVEPFRKQVAVINDKAKELSDPLDAVIQIANVKSNSYLRVLEDIKRKEDELLREAASMFDASEDIYIPPMEKNIRGEGATMIQKTEKKFRVLDITKIPTKYLMVDEDAVKRDLKLGLSEIAGIEVWDEKTTQLRIR